MNAIAKKIPSHRTPFAALARLDLSIEKERQIHGAIERTHSGSHPLWRALTMRRVDDEIFEVVEQLRGKRTEHRRYDVLTWELGLPGPVIGVRFHRHLLTQRGAMRVFARKIREASPKTGRLECLAPAVG